MITQQDEWVIVGLTTDGELFAEPDWSVRLCDSLAKRGEDGRKVYSSCVRPVITDGVKCVIVRGSLQGVDIHAFQMLRLYAAEHHLRVRLGRGSAEAAGKPPVVGKEQRDPHSNTW
ncbi:MAG: DUF3579 domain-containing protein [Gallionella sp.]